MRCFPGGTGTGEQRENPNGAGKGIPLPGLRQSSSNAIQVCHQPVLPQVGVVDRNYRLAKLECLHFLSALMSPCSIFSDCVPCAWITHSHILRCAISRLHTM
jgi:hypothetical protein